MEGRPCWRRRMPGRSAFDAYDVLSVFLVLGLVALVASTYQDYAVSNDEGVQQRYGELIIRYYESGLSDQSVFHLDNLYLYGGLFDVAATLVAKVLPFDLFSIRHILCAIIGIGGIAATGAAARMIAGPRAGLLAALMLALCGVWYGGLFNHTKDITFASAVIGAIYMLLRIARDLPRPRLSDVAIFGLLLGAALGLRALGLMLLIYVALAIADRAAAPRPRHDSRAARFRWARDGRSRPRAPDRLSDDDRSLAVGVARSLQSGAGALCLHALCSIRSTTLLAGHVYSMSEVPRWYIPVYLLIKLPLILLMGFGVALACSPPPHVWRQTTLAPRARREIGLVALTAAIPVSLHVISSGPAFTGMRHFLFVVPSLAVLAGVGCDALVTRFARWRPSAGMAAGVAVIAALAVAGQHPGAAASARISILQLARRRAQGRGRPLRHRLLGQRHAGDWSACVETHIAQTEQQRPLGAAAILHVDVCAERVHPSSTRTRWAAASPDRGLGRRRFLHLADPHGLRPACQGQGHRDGRTNGRADRRREGGAGRRTAARRAEWTPRRSVGRSLTGPAPAVQ